MPIFRVGSELLYYAHVPKCAGSSVEDYLIERFGPLAFLDRRYRTIPKHQRWSESSPQHIDCAQLERLFPDDFFAASFTVVRHPATRLISSFGYYKALRSLNWRVSFDDWLTLRARKGSRNPFLFDNHIRPMADFVPQAAAVFKLEQGTAEIVKWLDQKAGDTSGARDLPKSNKTEEVGRQPKKRWKRWVKTTLETKIPVLDESHCQKIYDLYREDYDRFGYGAFDPLEHKKS